MSSPLPDPWQGRPPGRPFKAPTPYGYRCLYCRKGVPGLRELSRHEHGCSARDSARQIWAREIERGRRKLLR